MPSRSFVGAVLDRAEVAPDALALVDSLREVTYGTLARDIAAAAARLQARGIAAGDRKSVV